MPLRAINDVQAPSAVLTALAAIMIANTAVQQAGGQIYANNAAPLNQLTAIWPSVLLTEKPQTSARISYLTWQTKLELEATYYNRWDQNASSMDQIWIAVDLDLRRMKANIEDNPTLTYSGTRYAEGVVSFSLSPYGQALSKTDSPFPVPVVMRTVSILINCLPYTSAM